VRIGCGQTTYIRLVLIAVVAFQLGVFQSMVTSATVTAFIGAGGAAVGAAGVGVATCGVDATCEVDVVRLAELLGKVTVVRKLTGPAGSVVFCPSPKTMTAPCIVVSRILLPCRKTHSR
jgi:hypothetical protein